jgi:uncharacterized protein (TIGR00299 family) protein
MSILKIEAFSGLSGDMFLGALAELTDAYDELLSLPESLGLEGVEIRISDVVKAGIACKHIKVIDHSAESASTSSIHQRRTDGGNHHRTPHRHLKDIVKLIDEGEIPAKAKTIAKSIFQLLGEAESKVHGLDIQSIHFHEVGAIDSIVDIVGTALLLHKLDIEETVATAICTGHGFVKADHGKMPIPAPATKELLLGIPAYQGSVSGEMTTPTGAAILKYLVPTFEIPTLVETRTGHGPGEKDFEHPNVLRLSLCEKPGSEKHDIFMIETNIDDMSAELLGNDFQKALIDAGAIDFYLTQVMMKKGRPGVLITVFCEKTLVVKISDFLMENTTTIGVRFYPVSRSVLRREKRTVKTTLGEVQTKVLELPSGKFRHTLEYESCKVLADKHQKPVSEIYGQLLAEINGH